MMSKGRANICYIVTQFVTQYLLLWNHHFCFLLEFRKVALTPGMQIRTMNFPVILKYLNLGAANLHFLKRFPLKSLLLLSVNFYSFV